MSHVLGACLTAIVLAGCAASASKVVAVQPLAVEQKAVLRISDVTAEAASGVVVHQWELDRICQRVKAELAALSPNPMIAAGEPADRALTPKGSEDDKAQS